MFKLKIINILTVITVTILILTGCSYKGNFQRKNDVSVSIESTQTEALDSDVELLGPYTVTKVVDGDTIDVLADGIKIRVRMIGVNTPESVAPDETSNNEYGKIASDFTKEKLSDKNVWLEYDIEKEDKYGRDLAYVYYEEDGQMKMFNKTLLEIGYAEVMIIEPNSKYSETFFETMSGAVKNKVGFWTDDTENIFK